MRFEVQPTLRYYQTRLTSSCRNRLRFHARKPVVFPGDVTAGQVDDVLESGGLQEHSRRSPNAHRCDTGRPTLCRVAVRQVRGKRPRKRCSACSMCPSFHSSFERTSMTCTSPASMPGEVLPVCRSNRLRSPVPTIALAACRMHRNFFDADLVKHPSRFFQLLRLANQVGRSIVVDQPTRPSGQQSQWNVDRAWHMSFGKLR